MSKIKKFEFHLNILRFIDLKYPKTKKEFTKKTPGKRKGGQVITPHLSWKYGKNIPYKGMLGFSFFGCRNFWL
jgi:hypothetical protein